MIWARKPIHVELMKVQQEVFAEVMAKLKPGLTVRELALQTEKASDKARPKSGHAANCIVKLTLHGRGAGDDGPIITNTSRINAISTSPSRKTWFLLLNPRSRAQMAPLNQSAHGEIL